jgi:3-methylcrotonyl-CoA carboxylase alpha subunit
LRRLLIANRGEIACRVMRSAREIGLTTIAVYSEADRDALHVAMAGEAYCVGPPPAAKSYLDVKAILNAAAESRADAIHPGYGFLSENAGFAEAVMARGIVWVGPSPETIRLMGDKETARRTAISAGVPVVPGSRRFAPGKLEGLMGAAAKVGFPLLVKAAAGGGGIGMRLAGGPDGLEALVVSVQEAAQKSFANGDVYLERFLPKARHVEIQVFGFGDGRAIHLFERDCSLQRRFQKVIEETPAPRLPHEVRERMCEAAVELCRATNYAGAGTVEFIVDAAGFQFYFLEMNTRIQVEHPITEMVTGVDLVAMQLNQAAGSLDPGDIGVISSKGASVQCRLYAENPAKMFFPSPGRLNVFRLPEPSPDLRIETGYREGDTVTPFYDPLIAKIIGRGETRAEAITAVARALEDVRVEGIATNRSFLLACLDHPAFAAGDVHTRFIDVFGKELLENARAFDDVTP